MRFVVKDEYGIYWCDASNKTCNRATKCECKIEDQKKGMLVFDKTNLGYVFCVNCFGYYSRFDEKGIARVNKHEGV